MSPHILLIDDDGFLASIYADRLCAEGFEVSLATNGEDGFKAAVKDHPDAIVLDLLMPRMDGFETLERLKTEPSTKDIPVLVLTNVGEREDVARCLKLGAAGYLIKAHTLPHEAVNRLRELIGSA